MGTKTETVDVDGLKFTITQLPGGRAYDLLMDLLTVAAPAAATALAGKDMDSNVGAAEVAAALGKALEALPREKRRPLLGELFASVTHQNVPVMEQLDVLFQGRMMTLMKLKLEAIRVNYGNFSGALAGSGSVLHKLRAMQYPSAESPSGGPSGESSPSASQA
jgi:hypothetical protein